MDHPAVSYPSPAPDANTRSIRQASGPIPRPTTRRIPGRAIPRVRTAPMTMLAPIRMSPRPRASAMQTFAMEGHVDARNLAVGHLSRLDRALADHEDRVGGQGRPRGRDANSDRLLQNRRVVRRRIARAVGLTSPSGQPRHGPARQSAARPQRRAARVRRTHRGRRHSSNAA